MSESSRSLHCRRGGGGGGNRLADGTTRPSASARRLVDAFWQDVDRSMLLEADPAASRRSLVPWSGASTEMSKRSRSRSKILEADGKGSRRNGHGRWFVEDMTSNGSAMEVTKSTFTGIGKSLNIMFVSELDTEKKSRKKAEKANKKLSVALANTEASLQAAMKELERERKSRGRVEKICSELIRGIDEDKAEVEALKRETEKAQEELQKEREMLQLADEWREQRVQMKLLEARLQFEEKNAAVNQLRDELQAYLYTRKEQEPTNDPMQLFQASENGAAACGASAYRNGGNCSDGGEDNASEDDGDMHSIELNVDGISKTCTWSYTPSSKGRQVHESFSDRGMDGANSYQLERSFRDVDENWRETGQKGVATGC
ncbi:hypothetical protein HU200_060494 [Digitaria exilis]|uniref:Uncharacterized protein n=1 Tax=Digitaria exilis TaxID=1010633 RepID=A0A835AEL7_9POAL|nr:hypothetical protein HU200_060494 [Digitaria exilis]